MLAFGDGDEDAKLLEGHALILISLLHQLKADLARNLAMLVSRPMRGELAIDKQEGAKSRSRFTHLRLSRHGDDAGTRDSFAMVCEFAGYVRLS